MTELSGDQRRLYEMLPEDGSAINGLAVLAELGWDREKFLRVRKPLIEQQWIGIGRGRGGLIFRLLEDVEDDADEIVEEDVASAYRTARVERVLYEPFKKSLEDIAEQYDLEQSFVEVTAHQGRRSTGGKWTRPDLVMVSVINPELVPGKVLEVETFEIKLANDALLGVFEAASHSRVVNKSTLAICDHQGALQEDPIFDRVRDECVRFKLGLITFTDAGDPATFFYHNEPTRSTPDVLQLDRFLQDQLSKEGQRRLRRWIS